MSETLSKMFDELPNELKESLLQLDVYPHGKGWTMVVVARHLQRMGYRDVAFRRLVVLPSGAKVYSDVYCGELNAHIICIADPSVSWVKGRASDLKRVDPNCRVIVALQEWLVNAVDMDFGADECWAVCLTGEVMKSDEWMQKRREEISKAVLAAKGLLTGLESHYAEVKEEYERMRGLMQDKCMLVATLLGDVINALGLKDSSLLAGREFLMSGQELLNACWRETKLTEKEIIKAVVNAANVILAKCTPYPFSVTNGGGIAVELDSNRMQWMSWSLDHVGKFPFPASLAEGYTKALKRDLDIATEAIKTAEATGKIKPERAYPILYFVQEKGEYPPSTIQVPRKTLEQMLEKIAAIEEFLDKKMKNLTHNHPEAAKT
ncbi:hypothetical protein H5T51_01550 [Candidatus Bathyarchaeota archaeon]|nr:hypothetical protein [Candidatus Bathyarchaeota archaeon]